LVSDDPPRSTSIIRLGELVVEPVLLVATHQRSSSVVFQLRDVFIVPIQRGDGAVVVACIEHDQIEELADLEGAPYA